MIRWLLYGAIPVFVLMVLLTSRGSSTTCGVPPSYRPAAASWAELLSGSKLQLSPEWTNDGSHLLVPIPDGAVYIVQADGSELRPLLEDRSRCTDYYSPDVSPDGQRIVYATSRHLRSEQGVGVLGRLEIETSNLDGSDPHRLTGNLDIDAAPAWSPDGTRIAFVKEVTPMEFRGIYTMSSDGSQPDMIVQFRSDLYESEHEVAFQSYVEGPWWSPDGESLVFVTFDSSMERDEYGHPKTRAALYAVSSDGSGLTELFSGSTTRTDWLSSPTWSPNGERLAFIYADFGDNRHDVTLYAIRADGSGLREVPIPGNVFDRHRGAASVSWSPDGKTLLVVLGEPISNVDGPLGPAYVVAIDGSEIHLLGRSEFGAWSPDGTRIALAGTGWEGVEDYLVTVAPDGSDRRVLARITKHGQLLAVGEK